MSVAECQKIELHLHLEGAAPPHFIRRLADEKISTFKVCLIQLEIIFSKILNNSFGSMKRPPRC